MRDLDGLFAGRSAAISTAIHRCSRAARSVARERALTNAITIHDDVLASSIFANDFTRTRARAFDRDVVALIVAKDLVEVGDGAIEDHVRRAFIGRIAGGRAGIAGATFATGRVASFRIWFPPTKFALPTSLSAGFIAKACRSTTARFRARLRTAFPCRVASVGSALGDRAANAVGAEVRIALGIFSAARAVGAFRIAHTSSAPIISGGFEVRYASNVLAARGQ